jgi:serine protease Do
MLRIDAGDATLPEPLKLGDSDTLMIGEQVLALGNPFGNLLEDSRPTVTVGYVSALSRDFRPDAQNQRVYQGMIQTDAAINPGNSGGPLVDLTGRVVGVNTFIFSPSGGSTGVGFALPINRVRAFVDEVRTFGRLRPLLLDFEVRSVRGRNNLRAVQIVSIDNTGPAMQAGLQLGDVIIEADGRPITSREEFRVLFASKQIGDTVRFRVLRGNDLVDVTYHVREARI